MDKRTRFIPEEKQLDLTIQDDLTQIRLANLSSEQTKLFVSYGFLQNRNCTRVPNIYIYIYPPFPQSILLGYILSSWCHPYHTCVG